MAGAGETPRRQTCARGLASGRGLRHSRDPARRLAPLPTTWRRNLSETFRFPAGIDRRASASPRRDQLPPEPRDPAWGRRVGGADRSLKRGDSDCGRNGSVFHLLRLCPSPQDATQELRPGSYQTPRSPSHPEGARGHPQPSWPPSAMLSQPPVMSPAREWLPSAHPCLHRFARRAISLR